MSKIVFINDPNTVYDGQFSQIGSHQVRLIFTDIVPSDDILLSGFSLVNEHNGVIQTKRNDYIYIYRKYSDNPKQIELCNDNQPWVKPEITVTFSANNGGILDGETTQIVDTYENLVVPTPVPNENYQFVKWNPEIPTSGTIENNITFVAEFEYVETLEEVRKAKIAEFNTICNQTIEAGQDITLSNGTVMHFDYTQYNQMNMTDGANLALSTKESVPYYDSSNNCYIFKAIDMATIYATCKGYVTYMLTLDHHLESMIKRMENKEDIKALTFSESSLDETAKNEFDVVMAQAQIVSDKYIANAIAVLG